MLRILTGAIACLAVVTSTACADVLVNVGSVGQPFSRNSTQEPAVAIDPIHPNRVIAGANDGVDEELCNAGDDHDCPYSPRVGGSGVYFSSDAGLSWTQPTYTGLTARGCNGVPGDADPDCVPVTGPIGTVPNYAEAGMRDDGDPGVAFGPRPGAGGHFSWANGSRMYYVNLASQFAGSNFEGYETVAVSYADDFNAAKAGSNAAWSSPKIAAVQGPDVFNDKPQIWADDAASSDHFGTVYVCYDPYTVDPVTGAFSLPDLNVGVSRDGGDTWSQTTAVPAGYRQAEQPGYSRVGCTVRTDSHGKVYVFAYNQPPQTPGARSSASSWW